MRRIRSFLPLFFLVFLYWGCEKADAPSSHPQAATTTPINTLTIYVPEHVVIASTPSASATKVETDAINAEPASTAVYEGYTKTYGCTSNEWTYVYTWTITLLHEFEAPSGTGQLTIGSYTTSAAFTIVKTQGIDSLRGEPTSVVYTLQYTLTAPNDNNYCNSSTLQETLSYTFKASLGPTYKESSNNSESADPNVYQTYYDVVGGTPTANGDGTFSLYVAPGVTVCGSACHISALGFPPTVTFYYSLEGSGTWQQYSQAGSDLNGFTVQLPQAGTYQYYTQEETAPGVTSGELGSGTITAQ
jgi:hypothetical protein